MSPANEQNGKEFPLRSLEPVLNHYERQQNCLEHTLRRNEWTASINKRYSEAALPQSKG